MHIITLVIYGFILSFISLGISDLLEPDCYAAIESIDIPRILSQRGGEAVYPLPRIKSLEVHPKLNLAALLFVVSTRTCISYI